jgi:tetratricopeptide (TPR) repeat protein
MVDSSNGLYAEQKEVRALLDQAQSKFDLGDTDASLQDLKVLIRMAKGTDRVRTFDLLARICVSKDQLDQALALYKNSLNHLGETDYAQKANIYNKMGLLFQAQRNIDEAIKYQEMCLDLVEKDGNKQSISITLRNLGRLYTLAGKHVEALRAHQRSLELKRTLGDHQGEAQNYETYAQDLEYEGKFEEAIAEYKKALEIFQDLKLSPEIRRVEDAIARIHAENEADQEFDADEMFIARARNAF